MKQEDNSFTKDDSKVIKGFAIILMLMHHLWAFNDRIAGGQLYYLFDIFGMSSIKYFGNFAKICVSLFFFVGGYGLYIKAKENKLSIISQIKKLYLNYYKVFLIFIPIAFIFFSSQNAYCANEGIYLRYSNFDLNEVLKNFIGYSSSLNGEWWFFKSYIIALLSFPFLKKLFDSHSKITNIFIIIILTILVCNVFPTIGYLPELGYLNNNFLYYNFICQKAPFISCFWIGMIFAKYDLLNDLKKKLYNTFKFDYVISIIGICLIIYIRQMVSGEILDLFLVPFLIIFFLNLIKKLKFVRKLFIVFGENSTNMWLTHSFYCYYFGTFAIMVMHFKWACVCLLILIIISLITSYLLNTIWKIPSQIIKITRRKHGKTIF